MRVVARLLKFGNRFIHFSGVEVHFTQFKAQAQICRKSLDTLAAFLDPELLALGLQFRLLLGMIGRGRVQALDLMAESADHGIRDLPIQ